MAFGSHQVLIRYHKGGSQKDDTPQVLAMKPRVEALSRCSSVKGNYQSVAVGCCCSSLPLFKRELPNPPPKVGEGVSLSYCGWTKSISHHPRNPGMLIPQRKYQQTFWFQTWFPKGAQEDFDFNHPQYRPRQVIFIARHGTCDDPTWTLRQVTLAACGP